MNKIYVPTESVDDWRKLLADPEKQWKTGCSARALAHAWEKADGFPSEIQKVFAQSESFQNIKLLLAIPEHRVALPGGGHPSQNDLWALGKTETGLVSIAVEGKVSEPLGPTVNDWYKNASRGKNERLTYLLSLFSFDLESIGKIRYQLLHRTASSIIEAQQYGANQAIMMIHSFSPACEWFDDFHAYAALFDIDARCDQLHRVARVSGIELFFAWIRGDGQYLSV